MTRQRQLIINHDTQVSCYLETRDDSILMDMSWSAWLEGPLVQFRRGLAVRDGPSSLQICQSRVETVGSSGRKDI